MPTQTCLRCFQQTMLLRVTKISMSIRQRINKFPIDLRVLISDTFSNVMQWHDVAESGQYLTMEVYGELFLSVNKNQTEISPPVQ